MGRLLRFRDTHCAPAWGRFLSDLPASRIGSGKWWISASGGLEWIGQTLTAVAICNWQIQISHWYAHICSRSKLCPPGILSLSLFACGWTQFSFHVSLSDASLPRCYLPNSLFTSGVTSSAKGSFDQTPMGFSSGSSSLTFLVLQVLFCFVFFFLFVCFPLSFLGGSYWDSLHSCSFCSG